MEICEACGLPVKPREATWLDIQVCRQTMSSPAEWDSKPFHAECAREDRDVAYERAAARYDGDGRDWR